MLMSATMSWTTLNYTLDVLSITKCIIVKRVGHFMDNCFLAVVIRTVDYKFLDPLSDEILKARACVSSDEGERVSALVAIAANAVKAAALNGHRDPHFCCDICREQCTCVGCKESKPPYLPFQMFPSSSATEDQHLTEQYTYTSESLNTLITELRRPSTFFVSYDQRWNRLDNLSTLSESNIQDIVDEALTMGLPAVIEYLDVLYIHEEDRKAILFAVQTFLV